MFVGLKMALSHWWHMETVASLGVIIAILVVAISASVLRNRRAEGAAIGDHVAREG